MSDDKGRSFKSTNNNGGVAEPILSCKGKPLSSPSIPPILYEQTQKLNCSPLCDANRGTAKRPSLEIFVKFSQNPLDLYEK